MNGLDIAHIQSYSNEEIVVFLEGSTDPVMQDLLRRVRGDEHAQEIRELQAECDRLQEEADTAEKDAEDAATDRDIAERLADEAKDERDEAQARVEQLEALLTARGIELPPEPADAHAPKVAAKALTGDPLDADLKQAEADLGVPRK